MSHLYRHPPKTGRYWLAYCRHGRVYRESLKTKDRTTARYLQAKKEQELAEGRAIMPDSKHTLTYLVDEYDFATQSRKRVKTLRSDKRILQAFIFWSSAQTVDDITERRLQEYLSARINGTYILPGNARAKPRFSPSSANRHIAAIKAFLNFCVRRNLIARNPVAFFRLYPVPHNPARFLTAEETSRLLAAAKEEDLYPAIITALYTGLRRAELFALEWPDIDFAQGMLTVRNKDGFLTKSRKFRVIPLHPALKSLLSGIARQSGPVFDVSVTGRRRIGRIGRIAKIPGVGWHTLRHTCASHLVMRGVDLTTVKDLLGHASITTTLIYAHLAPEHKKTAVEKLSFSTTV